MSSAEITGSFVITPLSVINNLEDAGEKIEQAGLIKTEDELLRTILSIGMTLATASKDDTVTSFAIPLKDICDELKRQNLVGNTLKSVRSKLKRLTEAGFFEAVDLPLTRGGRTSTKYVLQRIHEDDFETVDAKELRERAQGHRNARTQSTKAMLKYLRQSEAQLISHVRDLKPVTETIFTGVLDRAMRFTTFDKPPGNRITAKLRIKQTDILVQATTSTGKSAELAALPDQRVIRAVITEIAHFIDDEIERYVMEVEKPRQSSLFDDDDDIEVPDIFSFEETADEGKPDSESEAHEGEFVSRVAQQREAIEQAAVERIHNAFYIDVVNIAQRMKYASPHSSSTRRFINSSLRRLYETNFRLVIRGKNDDEIMEIMKLFDLDDISTDFRFLTVLKSQFEHEFMDQDSETQGAPAGPHAVPEQVKQTAKSLARDEDDVDPYNPDELKRVRVWRLSLDPHLFSKLLNKEQRKLFTAHNDIMTESSGLGQTLYNLFTQTIGRSNKAAKGKKENIFFLPLSDLHNILWPTRKYHRFEEEFIDLMKRYVEPGNWDHTMTINVARMFGYQFTLMTRNSERKKLWVRVERDKSDPLSGDDSYYNRVHNRRPDDITETA